MKAAAFNLVRPATLPDALTALTTPHTRPLSGSQSLGPMLNLRVARAETLVQINHLQALTFITETTENITIGAATTHATIAARSTGILSAIAAGIAYPAIRNRGTIGGSLAHADPAADWPTTLSALSAAVSVQSTAGTRTIPIIDLITAAYTTSLQPGELITAIIIPRPSANATWGYVKATRKPGEFAHAMAAILIDGPTSRLIIGATGGPPILLTGPDATPDGVGNILAEHDPIDRHLQRIIAHRALHQAETCPACL